MKGVVIKSNANHFIKHISNVAVKCSNDSGWAIKKGHDHIHLEFYAPFNEECPKYYGHK